jgi:hypothetical protein
MRHLTAILGLGLAAGCVTNLPPNNIEYLQIHWAPDFEKAQGVALAERKPLLVCLIAGQLAGEC